MDTRRKLIILADAAKCDASCASSGTLDLNRATKARLLPAPGLGVRSVDRLSMARRSRNARRADLDRLRVPVAKVLPFMALPDDPPRDGDSLRLRRQVRRRVDASAAASIGAGERQPDLFA